MRGLALGLVLVMLSVSACGDDGDDGGGSGGKSTGGTGGGSLHAALTSG